MRRTMSIGQAAYALGIGVDRLRYYEKKKLIFATRNGISGWRRFLPSEVERFSKVLDGLSKNKITVPTAE